MLPRINDSGRTAKAVYRISVTDRARTQFAPKIRAKTGGLTKSAGVVFVTHRVILLSRIYAGSEFSLIGYFAAPSP